MTNVIDRNSCLLGVLAVDVRNVLRGWRGGENDCARVAGLSSVGGEPATVLALLAELHDTGHMTEGPRGPDGLTERGRGLATATARRRMRRADAAKLMEGFLERAAAVNADPAMPMHVERVWLFGSMLSGDGPVGDVDLVVVAGRNPRFRQGESPSFSHAVFRAFRDEFPDSFGGMDVYRAPEELLSRRLHGPRRHPGISTSTDESTLCALGSPCRLVFDFRNGRVDGPLLPMHPSSRGREAGMDGRLPAPELSLAAEMRPCHVGFLKGGAGPVDDMGYVYDGLGYRRGLARLWGRFVASGEDGDGNALDGRARFGVRLEGPGAGTDHGTGPLVVVEREIEALDNGAAQVSATLRFPPLDVEIREAAAEWVRTAVTVLLSADVARLEARAVEAGVRADVKVSVAVDGDPTASLFAHAALARSGPEAFKRAARGAADVRLEVGQERDRRSGATTLFVR